MNPDLITTFIYQFAPSYKSDWAAHRRDHTYPIGRGPTEQTAIDDLLDQEAQILCHRPRTLQDTIAVLHDQLFDQFEE